VTVCGGCEEVQTWVISLSLLIQSDIYKEGYSPKSAVHAARQEKGFSALKLIFCTVLWIRNIMARSVLDSD
jgi:hypothetical protein